MAVRRCLPWPDKRLRTPADPVEAITDEILHCKAQHLIDRPATLTGLAEDQTIETELRLEALAAVSERSGQVDDKVVEFLQEQWS